MNVSKKIIFILFSLTAALPAHASSFVCTDATQSIKYESHWSDGGACCGSNTKSFTIDDTVYLDETGAGIMLFPSPEAGYLISLVSNEVISVISEHQDGNPMTGFSFFIKETISDISIEVYEAPEDQWGEPGNLVETYRGYMKCVARNYNGPPIP